jgi:hypothetical protein
MERHRWLARMKTLVWRWVRGVDHPVHGRLSLTLSEPPFRLRKLG